jgi:hypothetical protein
MKDVEMYKREMEKMLKEKLGVLHVSCYDVKVCPSYPWLREDGPKKSQARKNIKFQRNQFDALDPLLIEGPAKAAHNGQRVGQVFSRNRPTFRRCHC